MFELLACVALAVSSQTSTVVAATPPSSERLCANLAELASDEMNGRSFRSDDGKRAAEWVAAKFAAAGAVPLQGRASMLVPVAKMTAASPNVVAWFPPRGTTLSGEFILVTAHYDHLANARSGDDRRRRMGLRWCLKRRPAVRRAAAGAPWASIPMLAAPSRRAKATTHCAAQHGGARGRR